MANNPTRPPRERRSKARGEPERRCLVTGEPGGKAGLIRFVLDPDRHVVPDLAERLPGRGAWVSADRAHVDAAVSKGLFARAFKSACQADVNLSDGIEASLAERVCDYIGLARRAGEAIAGFDQVLAMLKTERPALLIAARDAGADGKEKLRRALRSRDVETNYIDSLTRAELSLALGRENVVHVALRSGGLAQKCLIEGRRLTGFRREAPAEHSTSPTFEAKNDV